jgi:hypothetical protein
MKGLGRGIGMLLMSVLAYQGATNLAYLIRQVGVTRHHDFALDVRFAPSMRTAIMHAIHTNNFFKTYSVKEQIAFLKSTFPAIGHCSSSLSTQGVATLTLHATHPVCLINHDYVMLQDGRMVPSDLFTDVLIASLPAITIPQELANRTYLEPDCKYFIEMMPWYITTNYDLDWHSATKILLRCKQQPHFLLVCNNSILPTPTILHDCTRIMHNLEIRGDFKKRSSKKKLWFADIRFEQQIVVYTACL